MTADFFGCPLAQVWLDQLETIAPSECDRLNLPPEIGEQRSLGRWLQAGEDRIANCGQGWLRVAETFHQFLQSTNPDNKCISLGLRIKDARYLKSGLGYCVEMGEDISQWKVHKQSGFYP